MFNDSNARPYVYKVTFENGQYYYGYHETNVKKDIPAHLDIGVKYFTSAPEIQKRMKTEKHMIEILCEFTEKDVIYEGDTPGDAAWDHEQFLIDLNWGDILMLNRNVKCKKDNGVRFKSKKGKENFHYGKTWEEIYGNERATEFRIKATKNALKPWEEKYGKDVADRMRKELSDRTLGKTLEELYGKVKATEMKQILAQKWEGKTWEEIYGNERAKELKLKRSELTVGKNNPNFGKHIKHPTESVLNRSGKNHPRYDHMIYHWINDDSRKEVVCTRRELCEEYYIQNLKNSVYELGRVIKKDIESYKGWKIKQ
jgi:hypothetical protein